MSSSLYNEGEKVGKALALFPTMYLSGGTCVTLIMIGAGSMKMFFKILGSGGDPLTTLEWYAVFTTSSIVLAQLPNLNSIAGVSLVGAISAVAYCTVTWAVSVVKHRPADVSYDPVEVDSPVGRVCNILNALGIIAFTFRGHNLVLEIQVWNYIIYFTLYKLTTKYSQLNSVKSKYYKLTLSET